MNSIDNSLRLNEDVPGLRCAVFPIDKPTYAFLLEGDPLHHASIDRKSVNPLDPMDAFFDISGFEHRILAAQLQNKRKMMGEDFFVRNAVTLRQGYPIGHKSER